MLKVDGSGFALGLGIRFVGLVLEVDSGLWFMGFCG